MNGLEKEPDSRTEEEKNVIRIINALEDTHLYMSEVTLGELYYGVFCSKRKEHNTKKLNTLIEVVRPLNVNQETWKMFAEEKAKIRRKGKNMSDLDLLVACTAKANSCILVTNDTGFDNISKSFQRVNWTKSNIR